MNVSAPLGSNATFLCTVRNAEIKWKLNDKDLGLDDEDLWQGARTIPAFRGETWSNSTVSTSVLIITASEGNNNSLTIACSAFGGFNGSLASSPPAFLAVFGKLCLTKCNI